MKINVGDLLKSSWEMVKSDMGFYIIGFLLVSVINSVTCGILSGPAMVGYYMAIMKKINKEQVAYGDIIHMGLDKLVPALLVTIIGGFAMSIGYVFLIVPGIVIGLVVMLALLIIADEDKDAVDFMGALKKGFEMFKANWKDVVVGSIVAGFVGSLGCVVCGLGCIVTMPICMVMMVKIYAELKGVTSSAVAAEAAVAAEPSESAAE